MVTIEQVRQALQSVMDPELGRNVVDLGMVRDVEVSPMAVHLTLALTTLSCPLKDEIAANVRNAILALDSIQQVDIQLAEMTAEEKKQLGFGDPEGQAEHLNHIRHVIAVVSGKGGVGKSLVTSLLAVGLRQAGNKVGVLDADITGPSIPKMFFAQQVRPGMSPMGIIPVESRTGIKVMSINLLLEREDQAVIWRGPIISKVIQQFWGDVFWGDLDYLIVDLPPGTSDASLTVLQSLPSSGVVLVTSPQDLAGMVVRKAAQLARDVGVPILGLVENMSYYACPETGKRHYIFGPGCAEELALQLQTPFLGRMPLDPDIARLCDRGCIEDYADKTFEPIVQRLVEAASPARRFDRADK